VPARRAIAVRGIVQGVGFRPFVHRLAAQFGLSGFVKNQNGSVLIEAEGAEESLDRFLAELAGHSPPLAQVAGLDWRACPPQGDCEFRIEASETDGSPDVFVAADSAPCADCLRELFDPGDRRYQYPFLNCTNCGPRLTIQRGVPYDRERTTLAGFPLCGACRAEYDDPANRRFHAQPTACPACGPRLELRDGRGEVVAVTDPVAETAAALLRGEIVAVKGLGGYHLVCDARRDAVVRELRRRKHRDEKPFAIMAADRAAAERLCELSPVEAELLLSPRRPIVLLRKRPGAEVADAVAPGNPALGVMLPYTPLHHLLMREVRDVPLVTTSGNRSDEPIAYEDADALARLAGIADRFLTHNRPIYLRCDDSVTRIVAGAEVPARRSRGYVPQPIELPFECPRPVLAVGGQMKNTFALARGRFAILSHHLGDLDHLEAFRAFAEAVPHYERLFGIRPAVVAHDLHPDYASTRYALEREGVELVAVQHHHAHLASCMAEHALNEPVIGVCFDGTGYGTDGAVWGGEFLVGDYRGFRRAAHFRYVPMPGGARAIREPWRMALAHLADAGEDAALLRDAVPAESLRGVTRLLDRRVNSPPTSSVGRLFDAVAALAGLRRSVGYEGQAAVELEALASRAAWEPGYPFDIATGRADDPSRGAAVVDTRPLVAAVARDVRTKSALSTIARRFHSTLVEVVARVCATIRIETGVGAVVLSGGTFLNAILTAEVESRLAGERFRVYRHRLVPPNDGGLSLGQLAIAADRTT
jgi:hydrogenase maturation protein HypF